MFPLFKTQSTSMIEKKIFKYCPLLIMHFGDRFSSVREDKWQGRMTQHTATWCHVHCMVNVHSCRWSRGEYQTIKLLSRAARRAARLKRNGSKKCAYEVCTNKWHGNDEKVRQKCQNVRHLQTAISQARNKLLTNFQRLTSTTMHEHMVCVQKSDMGMTKKWGKSDIKCNFKLQYFKLDTTFWQTYTYNY